MIPVAGKAFAAAKYKVDKMGTVTAFVYETVGWLAGEIMDATGLKEYMESLAGKFCNMFGNPFLAIEADFLSASCGSIAISGGVGTWPCTQECAGDSAATITYSGNKKVCDNDKPGSGNATCALEVSDEDYPDNDNEYVDYDVEVPDQDVEVPVSQELFETVTTGDNTPDATTTKKELPIPTEHTGTDYFQINYSSFNENTAPIFKSTIIPFADGTLHGAGYPGMDTMFYLDWNYFEATTEDTAPKAFMISGADWTRYVLFEETNTSTGSEAGSVWVNMVLPTGDKYLGEHQLKVAIFKRDVSGNTDFDGMGTLMDFNLLIVPEADYEFCWQPEDCDQTAQVCDENYHLCVDK